MMSNSNNQDNNNIIENVSTSFKAPIIKDILKSQFSNTKTKISNEAVDLITELAKVITVEAAIRAAKQATMEGRKTVTLDHAEAILPQMMLDFP